MTATRAQITDVKACIDTLKNDGPNTALRSLTDSARAAVLTDWLVHSVKLTPTQLDHLGNYLGRQAHFIERDNPLKEDK